ncbi:antigen 5 like allergen Cul n 1 [Stomoxys calcitrans]|uniref:antigen 5 like allergen Cul n 1 n=1 Tax=Stomoxys calcitrans TaxID=35570 RepID=UPI0027E25B98|nr:antigen 5 like allergen Cul n 1 [Stomoxys calcitrans]
MSAFDRLCALLLLLGAAHYSLAGETNYCDLDLCYGFEGHIACNNTGGFAPICASDVKIIPIRPELQEAIIFRHNLYRNAIAGGWGQYKPAAHMALTRWNPELARLAELNVRRCDAEHDLCRNTNDFNFAGQNIGVIYHRGNDFDAEQTALHQIDTWFAESDLASMDTINEYRTPEDGTQIGSFTGMVQEMGNQMGCAILQQTVIEDIVQQILTCNYSYINIEGLPVYIPGEPGSKCTTGTDPTFKALCSANEFYDVNDIPHYKE